MSETAIRALGVSRAYGLRFVLRNLDLTVAQGEALAIEGGNGTGKTTLLRVLATLLQPTSGSVEVFGENAVTHKGNVRRRIGAVFSESYFYSDLTVTENLRLYATLYALPDADRRIAGWLTRFKMEPFASAQVRTLSRGERQRVSIIRSLLHDPDLLIWDEPFVGLDVNARGILNDVARELKGRKTLLCVSHESGNYADWIDRRLSMANGRFA